MVNKKLRVLELFSGTGSFSKVCTQMPKVFETVTLDINPRSKADIIVDILKWNYKSAYPERYFDIIWASPECIEYSRAKTRAPRDIPKADALVKRTLAIIKYFKPQIWFLENPQTGLLKTRPFMTNIPYTDVTYCKYGYPYMKPTRIWTNLKEGFFEAKFCHKDCQALINGKHIINIGRTIRDLSTPTSTTEVPRLLRNSIPPRLVRELLMGAVKQMGMESLTNSIRRTRIQDVDWSFLYK
jgi:hypothetical protein